ncbi:unnamed protein product [Alopecurus aequalis]
MSTPRHGSSLPDDIVWEILVRLPPKSLIRCRSVCRAWRRVTYARGFLLAHHARQPSLPIYSGHKILAFDRRAATDGDQLHTVAQLDEVVYAEASCDGLLVLSASPSATQPRVSMLSSSHRATSPSWRRWKVSDLSPKDQIACYVFVLGSDQPLRYIERPAMASGISSVSIWLHNRLHWYPVYHRSESNPEQNVRKRILVVFDTISETFRLMRGPIVPNNSYICEVDGTLGIYTHNYSTQVMDIQVLQNYERDVWDLKYRIKLPVAEIRMTFQECDEYCDLDADDRDDYWDFNLFSMDSGVALLVYPRWLLHVDCDGKLVNSFYRRRWPPVSLNVCSSKVLFSIPSSQL